MTLANLLRKSRSRQQLRNENTLKRLEIQLRRAVKNAKAVFIEDCASSYESHKERDFHGELIAHRVAITQLLQQQARVVIPTFGRQTMADIHAIAVKADDESYFSQLIDQWILNQGLQRASGIAQTSLDDVQNALQAGIDAGDGTDAIARRIRKLSALSGWRAQTVAQTEAHQAALFAQAMTAQQAETTYDIKLLKTWLPTLDERTRPDHAAMADYPAIPLDEKFIVGGEEMDRPGDPAGSAAQTVNCLHPSAVIDFASPVRLMRRWFDGQMITIHTASGNKLTVTPNHPILTPTGWKLANVLQKGGRIVSARGAEDARAGCLDIENIKPSVEQIRYAF
jgi:hypothetical protein